MDKINTFNLMKEQAQCLKEFLSPSSSQQEEELDQGAFPQFFDEQNLFLKQIPNVFCTFLNFLS
jgi:hypothetical protein